MAHAWTICREVDLARDFVGVERIAALATTSAKAAHELRIAVTSGGKTVGMDGASVVLNLILPDGVSTTADGSIEAGTCIVTLPPLCYQRGETRGVLLLQFGTQAAIPVYAFVLRCFEDLTDAFTDPDHVIPSLAEILAQLDAAKAAAKAAQDGASAANAAAGTANAEAEDAAAAAKGADDAARAAIAAALAANAAAGKIDAMTVSATPVSTGTATAALSTVDGHYHLALGLPKGNTGATPQISVQVATGAAGSEASVSVSGTAENPVIHLTIPRGDVGDIGSLTINGKTPDGSSAVTLTPGDLGAASAEAVSQLKDDKLDKTGTAADSSKLGGKTLAEIMLALYPVGSIYISTSSTSPASLFGGTWEQLKDRFLLGAGDSYTAGSTGGESTHKLTTGEIPAHVHDMPNPNWTSGEYIKVWPEWSPLYEATQQSTTITCASGYTQNTGGSQPHNNMPPYLVVYMWKRVS